MKVTKSILLSISKKRNFDSFVSGELYISIEEALSGKYVIDGYMINNEKGGYSFVYMQ